MVKPQLPKLMLRVRFPLLAPQKGQLRVGVAALFAKAFSMLMDLFVLQRRITRNSLKGLGKIVWRIEGKSVGNLCDR